MKITIAKDAGYCFGVRDAVNLAYDTAEEYGEVYMLGDIVHNENVIHDLDKSGAKVVNNIDEVPKDKPILLRAHGTKRDIWLEANKRKMNVVDATCPLVHEIHNEVKKLAKDGRQIFVIGDHGHDEVIAIADQVPNTIVIASKEEARKIKDAIVKGEAYETPSEEVIGPAQERLGKKIAVMTERLERDKLDMATMKKTVEVETKAQKEGERGHKLIFAEDKVKSLTDKIAKDQETLLKLREGIGKDDLIEKTENPDTDSDVGERTSEIRIGKRAAWFAEKWMKDAWDIDADIHIKKDLKTLDLN